MSGHVAPLFHKQEFDFSGGNGTVVVVRQIDVSRWTQGEVLVRVHSNSITGSTTGTIAVVAKSVSLTNQDPATDFIDGTAVATATVSDSSTAGTLKRASLTTPFGSGLQIQVVATKGTSTTVKATISVDLVVKD
jgi:hypothetical protein